MPHTCSYLEPAKKFKDLLFLLGDGDSTALSTGCSLQSWEQFQVNLLEKYICGSIKMGIVFYSMLLFWHDDEEAWHPNTSPDGGAANLTEFIRSSCQGTLYPDLCFASLARYAPAVKQNPIRLARFAAMVTLFQIHSTTSHVSAYLRGSKTGSETAALKDCVDFLRNAADQTRSSATEIGKLDHEAVGPEVAWRVSNAQTWMSAALTNEETCTDGFDNGDQGRVTVDVLTQVGRAKQYTSNTLALVNCLANGR